MSSRHRRRIDTFVFENRAASAIGSGNKIRVAASKSFLSVARARAHTRVNSTTRATAPTPTFTVNMRSGSRGGNKFSRANCDLRRSREQRAPCLRHDRSRCCSARSPAALGVMSASTRSLAATATGARAPLVERSRAAAAAAACLGSVEQAAAAAHLSSRGGGGGTSCRGDDDDESSDTSGESRRHTHDARSIVVAAFAAREQLSTAAATAAATAATAATAISGVASLRR